MLHAANYGATAAVALYVFLAIEMRVPHTTYNTQRQQWQQKSVKLQFVGVCIIVTIASWILAACL